MCQGHRALSPYFINMATAVLACPLGLFVFGRPSPQRDPRVCLLEMRRHVFFLIQTPIAAVMHGERPTGCRSSANPLQNRAFPPHHRAGTPESLARMVSQMGIPARGTDLWGGASALTGPTPRPQAEGVLPGGPFLWGGWGSSQRAGPTRPTVHVN